MREYITQVLSFGTLPFSEDVLLWDDFSNGLKWSAVRNKTEGVFEVVQEAGYRSGCSLKMATSITGTQENDYVFALRYFPVPTARSIRLICSLNGPGRGDHKYTDYKIRIFDGTYDHQIAIRFNDVNDKLQYLDENNSYVDVPGGAVSPGSSIPCYIKFSANLATGKYNSLEFQGSSFDLSDYSYYRPASTGARYAEVRIGVTASGTNPAVVWINAVLIDTIGG